MIEQVLFGPVFLIELMYTLEYTTRKYTNVKDVI